MCRSVEIMNDDSLPVTVEDNIDDGFDFLTTAIRHSHSPYDHRLQNARVAELDKGQIQVSIRNNSSMLPQITVGNILVQSIARFNKVFSCISVTWGSCGNDCNWKNLDLVMRPRTSIDSTSFVLPTITNDFTD